MNLLEILFSFSPRVRIFLFKLKHPSLSMHVFSSLTSPVRGSFSPCRSFHSPSLSGSPKVVPPRIGPSQHPLCVGPLPAPGRRCVRRVQCWPGTLSLHSEPGTEINY